MRQMTSEFRLSFEEWIAFYSRRAGAAERMYRAQIYQSGSVVVLSTGGAGTRPGVPSRLWALSSTGAALRWRTMQTLGADGGGTARGGNRRRVGRAARRQRHRPHWQASAIERDVRRVMCCIVEKAPSRNMDGAEEHPHTPTVETSAKGG